MKKWMKKLKSEKGFTLVELLAVIVILGILAAIAVPMIGNVIANSKEDSYTSAAQQAVEAARLADASGDFQADGEMTLDELVSAGYLSEYAEEITSGSVVKSGGNFTATVSVNGKDYTASKSSGASGEEEGTE